VFRPTILAAVTVLALAAPALAADFTLDPKPYASRVHGRPSRLLSRARADSAGLRNALGRRDDVPTAVTATLSAKDIDSHSADRDRDLRGADWLEVDKFPTMTLSQPQITGTRKASRSSAT